MARRQAWRGRRGRRSWPSSGTTTEGTKQGAAEGLGEGSTETEAGDVLAQDSGDAGHRGGRGGAGSGRRPRLGSLSRSGRGRRGPSERWVRALRVEGEFGRGGELGSGASSGSRGRPRPEKVRASRQGDGGGGARRRRFGGGVAREGSSPLSPCEDGGTSEGEGEIERRDARGSVMRCARRWGSGARRGNRSMSVWRRHRGRDRQEGVRLGLEGGAAGPWAGLALG